MKKVTIILTFDYELPLGGVKVSYDHSLFNPFDRLLEVIGLLQVPVVFFVDILSLVKFREWNEKNYVDSFTAQIKQMINYGHDVQLHLHPHWLDSNFYNGKIVPSEKYGLGDFVNGYPKRINEIVEMGITELEEIAKSENKDYSCIAYRAGGYNLEPHTDKILKALYDHGIRFDSSISRGYFFKSDTSLVDYRKVPNFPNWFLSLDGDLTKNATGEKAIFEIPIASKPKGLFEMPTSFKLKRYTDRAVENRGVMIHTHHKMSKSDKFRQLLSSRMLTVDNHTFSPDYLMKILNYNVSRFQSHDVIYLSLIGHPKSMSEYHYYLLTEFVNRAKDKYGEMLSFATFESVYDQLNFSAL